MRGNYSISVSYAIVLKDLMSIYVYRTFTTNNEGVVTWPALSGDPWGTGVGRDIKIAAAMLTSAYFTYAQTIRFFGEEKPKHPRAKIKPCYMYNGVTGSTVKTIAALLEAT